MLRFYPRTFASKRTRRFSSALQKESSVFVAPTTPPLLDTTYHNLLSEQTSQYPHKDCFRNASEDTNFTVSQIMRHQDAVASGMVETAGRPGTTTAIALPLRTETFMTQLGAARAHRLWSPLRPAVSAQVLVNQLKAINPGTLVWPAKVHKKVQLDEIYQAFPTLESHPRDIQLQDKRFPYLRHIVHTAKTELAGMIAYADTLVYNNKRPLKTLEKVADAKALNTILVSDDFQTVSVSQYNIINTGQLIGQKLDINAEDIVCTTLLLSSASGLALGIGMTLPLKAKLVYTTEMFDSAALTTSLQEEFCTALVAQPSELQELINRVTEPFPRLNKIFVAASPQDFPSVALLESLGPKLGAKSVIVVFATQTHVISATNVNTFVEKSIGFPLPHSQVKVVSDGNVVSKGTTGSLVISGFNAEGTEVNTGVLVSMGSDGSLTLN